MSPDLVQGMLNHEDEEVVKGCAVLQRSPEPCSDAGRTCKDGFCALSFFIVVGFVGLGALQGITAPEKSDNAPAPRCTRRIDAQVYDGSPLSCRSAGCQWRSASRRRPSGCYPTAVIEFNKFEGVGELPHAIPVGAVIAVATAMVFLEIAKRFTTSIVWISLLLGPSFLIISGLIILVGGSKLALLGFVLVAIGLCQLACVFCCWSHFIPFTVLLIQTSVDIIKRHCFAMTFFPLVFSTGALLWSVMCVFSFYGFARVIEPSEVSPAYDQRIKYLVGGGEAFLLYWGSMVALNTCFVACSGIFARWYFGKDKILGRSASIASLKVACVTSFGSICFGSFIVAAIRALEFVIRQMKRDARDEGNFVLMIMFCILESIISCLGDIIEWFNSFVYVQCAVRGLGFMDAARVTYALCTYANIHGICACSLVRSVIILGALPCGFAAGTAAAMSCQQSKLLVFCITFVIGWLVGMAILEPLQSGSNTLVVCWAESPDNLKASHPTLHTEFANLAYDWTDGASHARPPVGTVLQPGADPRVMHQTPMMEMQHHQQPFAPVAAVAAPPVVAVAAPVRQMQVVCPTNVSPGQAIQFCTPDGQTMEIDVPPGISPGQLITVSY